MRNSTADYFISLGNELSKIGKVIIVTGKIRETNISLNPDIIVLKWPSKRPTKFKDFVFLLKIVKNYRPDMMISIFGMVSMFLIVGWLFRVKIRIAWIRTLSTQFSHKKIHILRKSIIYRFSTQIITNSTATKIDAANFYKIKKSKIKVLPNSVSDYSHLLLDIPRDNLKLVYVGRLHPEKGVDVLIRAVSILLNKNFNVHLDIIGIGNSLNMLTELTKTLQISKSVNFLGSKSKIDVLRAFKNSFCAIVPSYTEAFGYTVIEAMSAGSCVIGADNTGIKETIIDNETGLLFRTGDEIDLAIKLERVLTNVALRDNLAENGFKNFLESYENNYAIKRDFKFLKGLLKEV
ncbi:hypothetical protein GCM10022257_00870 [Hyunsoonleella aestuarii]|uniref:Glycosyl transferase family 1 domain-containing protein n=2 Tax=Hyunsoonleella aestuarii TaxID=912802 RepID=A0ABP8E7D2_9FLAO